MPFPDPHTPEGTAILELNSLVAEAERDGGDVAALVRTWLDRVETAPAEAPAEAPADAEPAAARPEVRGTLHDIGLHAVLALAARRYSSPGPREQAIREELGLSPARYFQVLNSLLDSHEALRADPVTVHRLQRLRTLRRTACGRPDPPPAQH